MRQRDQMRKRMKQGGAIALTLFLAACGSSERPWWHDDGPRSTQRPSASSRTPVSVSPVIQPVQPGGTYVVKRGDTVYSIARAHDVPLRSLIDTNSIHPPYDINVNQRLTIPAGRFHVVQRGETVYSISRTYNVDMSTLTSLNRVAVPYTIKVGEKLQIPSSSSRVKTAEVAPPPPASGTTTSTARPMARPDGTVTTTPAATTTPSQPKGPLPATPAPVGNFIWPHQGKTLSSFGPKANGLHNDGINIAAAVGDPIKAAQSGVVAYSGNELKGYGNLLLIRHQNDWITAYAHNSKLLVKRGDQVTRGQVISHAGNTGSVTTPQLHFEIRKGSKAVDPLTVLGR